MKARFFVLAAIFFGSFFIFSKVFCANTDIVVNEIGAYPTSTHEWVEIWNKGSDPVDLTGWKFWENSTNHGLMASTTDSVVSSHEYAAICQDEGQFLADHPGFPGSVFDSSWTSLSEDGEEIGLKDSGGNFIEKFTYGPAHGNSLERVNPLLNDYTNDNWKASKVENTVGFVNSNFSTATTTTSTDGGETDTTTPSILTSTIWAQMKINEFMPDPESGNEWVELYNPSTSSLDVGGGFVCDSRNTTSTCKTISGNISSFGWLFLDLFTNSYLNNDGDAVILKNSEGNIVDQFSYGSSEKGDSYARTADGADTDSNSDWAVTTQPTPGAANIIVAPVVPQPNSGGSSQANISQTQTKVLATSTVVFTSSSLIINELFPYPGDDDEFIEIKNNSSSTVDLSGWKLADLVKQFSLSGTIAGGKLKVFEKSLTGIALNNSTKEVVSLINPSGAVAGRVSYSKAIKDQSYSFGEDKKWHWTETVTPGEENIIQNTEAAATKTDHELVWKIKYDPRAKVGEKVLFDATKTLDTRGGRIIFGWDFGEGRIASGNKLEYVFSTSGSHNVIIQATSTAGTVDNKQIKVMVYPSDIKYGSGVIFSEISPNPESDDEYIKIKNIATGTVDISNWKLMYKTNIYQIPTGTYISAGDYLTFYKPITGFSLSNTGGELELRLADDALADTVEFGKSKVGQIYTLKNNGWVWTAEIGGATAQIASVKVSAASAKKIVPTVRADIYDVRDLAKDQNVIVDGFVSVLPAVFGTQYFYITDGDSGIQIYQYKKDFPKLNVGDKVEVTGVLAEASGVKRIRVKGKNNIDILSTNNIVSSTEVAPEDLNEDYLGSLVKVAGEITEIKTTFMYIDDGNSESVVYFKQGAKIDKSKFLEGENVEVTGVLEQSKTGLQIWPRSQDDIISQGPSQDLLNKQAVLEKTSQSGTTGKYLTATAGGVMALFLGFLARARGEAIKKLGLSVVGLVRKKKV